MAGEDFQKGGDKKSEGLGLRTGIKKAKKKREDRINGAINLGAKELITKFKLVESVIDQVDMGGNTVRIVLPSEYKIFTHDVYEGHGAVESDKIIWETIFGKMREMMENEGVKMVIRRQTHGNQRFFHSINLKWDPHD